jgi:RNA recognition motif-containing protein
VYFFLHFKNGIFAKRAIKTMTSIFIVGFPKDTTPITLLELFSQYGTVENLNIVEDPKTGLSKGYAFIQMKSLKGAERAVVALNGSEFKGRKLTVKIGDKDKQKTLKVSKTYQPKPGFKP